MLKRSAGRVRERSTDEKERKKERERERGKGGIFWLRLEIGHRYGFG